MKINHKDEARALIELANNNGVSSSREVLIAAMGWELMRYAHFQRLLPKACLDVMAGRKPSLSMHFGAWDEILSLDEFPNKKWCEISKENKQYLVRVLAGEQSKAAIILDGNEAYRQASWFTAQDNRPGFRPMDDGGAVCILRVYPGCGLNNLKKDIAQELQRIMPKQKRERANSNDVRKYEELLKGLAALWLDGHARQAEQNRMIFPTRAGAKADYTALKKARSAMKAVLKEAIQHLKAKAAPSEEAAKAGKPLLAEITAAIRRYKRQQK